MIPSVPVTWSLQPGTVCTVRAAEGHRVETPTELARMIRFALDELSGENGHHTFEDLCREMARARLASNILPATGPVAGGGDQGRDFETFRTYLAGSLRFSRGFIGLASPDTVAFACTLQHDDVSGKIKEDLTSVCTQGTPVDAVYFLCTVPVKVSTRHGLQAWAKEKFSVTLEVLDGPAIARHLTDHDTFWIARTYLHLPASLSPAPPARPLRDHAGHAARHRRPAARRAPRPGFLRRRGLAHRARRAARRGHPPAVPGHRRPQRRVLDRS